jgi:antitoxin component YwqK of YwqJK toxin-antitoxin module
MKYIMLLGIVLAVSCTPRINKKDYLFEEIPGQTINGEKHGEWKSVYLNGNTRSVENYKDGVLHGEYLFFYSNGVLRAKRYYNMGTQVDSAFGYHDNGNINYRKYYVNDMP